MKNPIEIYQSQDGKTQVSVQFDKETVWLSLQQMADIFGRDKSVISRHLRNIYQEGELEREATVAKMQQFKLKVLEKSFAKWNFII